MIGNALCHPASQRKIIHIDMDCFYAAVETRDNPALRGKAVAVGGAPDQRGVLCTCNYTARRYGLRSAMPTAQAFRLCPDLIVLPVDMPKYRAVSAEIHEIFTDFSDTVEPLSLDEAYLDVSRSMRFRGSATLIAQEIRRRIREYHQLTASAGVAENKLLAKIAGNWHKPDGLYVIKPEQVAAFIAALPVDKLHGVGKVTAQKLKQQGILLCADLQKLSLAELNRDFGKFGQQLYQFCRGKDERPVSPSRIRKSLSVEETYQRDLAYKEDCLRELETLYPEFLRRLRRLEKQHTTPVKSLFVKIKFTDFTQTTAQKGAFSPRLETFKHLCTEAYSRHKRPVRLLGLGVQFEHGDKRQLELPLTPHL